MKFSWLFLGLLFLAKLSFAQNLVNNPSFEQHEPIDCLSCHIFNEEFAKTMHHWRNLNSHTTICDCTYQRKNYEGPYKYSRTCPSKVSAKEGCNMIQMQYKASCLDWDHKTRGCSSYLGTELKEKLQMGKKYEISFWLYLEEPTDPDFANHIGILLFPKKIRNPRNALLEQDNFKIDTIIYNKWYKVSWNIQPTCPLQYLVLGVFRGENGPPVHSKQNYNLFYVDDISVREMSNTESVSSTDVSLFCKPALNKSSALLPEIDGVTTYFDSGKDLISPAYKRQLDSFAYRAKEQPKVAFQISGHTDDVGSDHIELSKKRIESVLLYLESKHNIPRIRFISLAKGIDQPASKERSEEARKLNRRVEIRHVDYPISNVVYRNLLEYNFQQKRNETYRALNIWLHMAPQKSKVLMLNDPRIDELKEGARWTQIEHRVHKDYNKLIFSLDSLWAEDQRNRTLKYYIENLNTYIASIDSSETKWDVNFESSDQEISRRDNSNFIKLVDLIGKDNWVKTTEVGKRAASANFLIVQHNTDIKVLSKYLPILKKRCMEGEAKWLYYAMMYDRIKILQNQAQRYGTQFKVVNKQQQLFPLEDKTRLNEWRNEIGLEQLDLNSISVTSF